MIYFIELDESENFIKYEKHLRFLSAEKQVSIRKFRYDIDKKLSLFSDVFVRYLACQTNNLNNSELIFNKGEYGKPYLVGVPNFNYNISHTRSAIIIGLSQQPIGVDIEKLKSADLKIAERFFCKNECAYISSIWEQQDKLFYEIWTKKEAYIKWNGKGLSLPLNSFDVTDVDIRNMLAVFAINDYIFSVCCDQKLNSVDAIYLDEHQATQILANFLGFHSI